MNFSKTIGQLMLTLPAAVLMAACGPSGDEQAEVRPAEETQARTAQAVATAEEHSGAEKEAEIIAYGRFVPEREDDFAWENDKVAFRVYGPGSSATGQASGVDAWLKKVSYPIIDKWYEEHLAGKSYHEDHGEGYDPFHVGNSRGVGGSAIWIDGEPWPAGTFSGFEILHSGGEVVEFMLEYEWDTPLGQVGERKTVRLETGKQLYRVDSSFSLDGQPAALPVAIGLTTHDGAAQVYRNEELGRISTWEVIDGHGVGTGALVAPERVDEVTHVQSEEKDVSHIWLVTATTDTGKLTYRAGFAWEAAGEITSAEDWNEYLDARAGR